MRCLLVSSLIALVCAPASPGWGWLFDAGPPHHAAAMVRDGSNLVAAAAPFAVPEDSYLTSIGAAAARAFGPADAGFHVYLTTALTPVADLPSAALADWTLIPPTSVLEYCYAPEGPEVFLEARRVYYLVFVPTAQDFWGAISWSLTGFYGRGNADYGPEWRYLEYPLCIRVGGYLVPEPSGGAALAFGLLGTAGSGISLARISPWRRRRTRRRERLEAADPE